jgi:hypothetical protein
MDAQGTLKASLKLCHGDAECVIRQEMTDCCGTILLVGIATSSVAAFDSCEAAWQAHFGLCGCRGGPTTTEDGKQINPGDGGAPRAHCTNLTSPGGVCMTYVP